jgi:hypothetical protein
MAIRPYGKTTKILVENHISVTQFETSDSDLLEAEDLKEPIAPEIDGEITTIVDEILVGYDKGNGVPAEEPSLDPDRDNPLIIDIDDGSPDPPRNRVGALKRVDSSTRSYSKFNRFTDVWE